MRIVNGEELDDGVDEPGFYDWHIDYASDQLHKVTEQRDELLRYNEAFRKETLICADCDSISKEEYDRAIEQRDRLAEALNDVMNSGDSTTMYRTAKVALQSLTTNAESIRAGVDSD